MTKETISKSKQIKKYKNVADIITVTGSSNKIYTNGGKDRITLSKGKKNMIDAGKGIDTVIVGKSAGSGNKIYGGAGGDKITINGGKGNYIYGDDEKEKLSGNDSITVNGGSRNTVYGGKGNDTITIAGGSKNNIYGGKGNDTFVIAKNSTGTAVVKDFNVKKGNTDKVKVLGGAVKDIAVSGANMVIKGGKKASVTLQGAKNKTFTVTDTLGNYTVSAANVKLALDKNYKGNLTASSFITTVDARSDANAITIYGNAKNNTIYGGAGANTIYGNTGNDTMDGGAGNDTLYGGAGNDNLTGGAGNDTFVYANGEGNDTLTDYTAGQDVLQISGGSISRTVLANGNKDVVFTAGNGSITLKNAADKVISLKDSRGSYTASGTAITLGNDFTGTVDASNYLSTVETIDGSNATKTVNLTGNAQNNSIFTGKAGGNISAGAGADTITVNNGTVHTLRGGTGSDKYVINVVFAAGTRFTINQDEHQAGDADVLYLNQVNQNDVSYDLLNGTLTIEHASGGVLTVSGWNDNPFSTVVFKDGEVTGAVVTKKGETKEIEWTLGGNITLDTGVLRKSVQINGYRENDFVATLDDSGKLLLRDVEGGTISISDWNSNSLQTIEFNVGDYTKTFTKAEFSSYIFKPVPITVNQTYTEGGSVKQEFTINMTPDTRIVMDTLSEAEDRIRFTDYSYDNVALRIADNNKDLLIRDVKNDNWTGGQVVIKDYKENSVKTIEFNECIVHLVTGYNTDLTASDTFRDRYLFLDKEISGNGAPWNVTINDIDNKDILDFQFLPNNRTNYRLAVDQSGRDMSVGYYYTSASNQEVLLGTVCLKNMLNEDGTVNAEQGYPMVRTTREVYSGTVDENGWVWDTNKEYRWLSLATGTAGNDNVDLNSRTGFGTKKAWLYFAGDGNDKVTAHAGDIVYGGSGDDTINATGSYTDIQGGIGNDTITVKGVDENNPDGAVNLKHAVVRGGSGNDFIKAYGSYHFIQGGAGADTIELRDDGNEGTEIAHNSAVAGGTGNDTISILAGHDHRVNGGDGDDTIYARLGDNHILNGGAGNDEIRIIDDGTKQSTGNVAYGGAGNDKMFIKNGGKSHVLDGGADGDTLSVDGSNNTLDGGEGDDTLTASGAGNTLYGRTGIDELSVIGNNNTLDGGDGNDTLSASGDNNTLDGGEGDDTLTASGDGNTLDGHAGIDELSVIGNNNTLDGGEGDDTLNVSGDNNTIDGGEGDDRLVMISGAGNELTGGNGFDTFVYAADSENGTHAIIKDYSSAEDVIKIASGTITGTSVNENNDVIFTMDAGSITVEGGAAEGYLHMEDAGNGTYTVAIQPKTIILDKNYSGVIDAKAFSGVITTVNGSNTVNSVTIYANDQGNSLLGGGKADQLHGGAGDDELSGDSGDDKLFGDKGTDRLSGGDGSDELHGGDGNDVLQGDKGADFLYGDAGEDWLYGNDGNDYLYGGEDGDNLYGAEGTDYLYGETGNDWLDGGEGNDTLDGGTGNDSLFGRGGNDILYGGSGNNELYGGEGTDTFIFNEESIGYNTIGDYGLYQYDELGENNQTVSETIKLEGITLSGEISLVDGSNVQYGLSNGGTIKVKDVMNQAVYFDNNGEEVAYKVAPSFDDKKITLVKGSNVTLTGGTGNDVLTIDAAAGNGNQMLGGEGDDSLYVNGGNNHLLRGGTGNDMYIISTLLTAKSRFTIQQEEAYEEVEDSLFLTEVDKDDVSYVLLNGTLSIIHSSGGKITVSGWDNNPLRNVYFANNDSLTGAEITDLANKTIPEGRVIINESGTYPANGNGNTFCFEEEGWNVVITGATGLDSLDFTEYAGEEYAYAASRADNNLILTVEKSFGNTATVVGTVTLQDYFTATDKISRFTVYDSVQDAERTLNLVADIGITSGQTVQGTADDDLIFSNNNKTVFAGGGDDIIVMQSGGTVNGCTGNDTYQIRINDSEGVIIDDTYREGDTDRIEFMDKNLVFDTDKEGFIGGDLYEGDDGSLTFAVTKKDGDTEIRKEITINNYADSNIDEIKFNNETGHLVTGHKTQYDNADDMVDRYIIAGTEWNAEIGSADGTKPDKLDLRALNGTGAIGIVLEGAVTGNNLQIQRYYSETDGESYERTAGGLLTLNDFSAGKFAVIDDSFDFLTEGNDVPFSVSAGTVGNDEAVIASRQYYFGAQGDDEIIVNGSFNRVSGDDGIDSITIGSAGESANCNKVNGGEGNDTIIIQNGNHNTIFTGVGNDNITLHEGTLNYIYGEKGANTFIINGGYENTVYTGIGNDTIELNNIEDSNRIFAMGGDDTITINGQGWVAGGTGSDSYTVNFVAGSTVSIDNRKVESGDSDTLIVNNVHLEDLTIALVKDYNHDSGEYEGTSLVLTDQSGGSIKVWGWDVNPLQSVTFTDDNEVVSKDDILRRVYGTDSVIRVNQTASYTGTEGKDFFIAEGKGWNAVITGIGNNDVLDISNFDIPEPYLQGSDVAMSLRKWSESYDYGGDYEYGDDEENENTVSYKTSELTLAGFADANRDILLKTDSGDRHLIAGPGDTLAGTNNDDIIIVSRDGQTINANGGNRDKVIVGQLDWDDALGEYSGYGFSNVTVNFAAGSTGVVSVEGGSGNTINGADMDVVIISGGSHSVNGNGQVSVYNSNNNTITGEAIEASISGDNNTVQGGAENDNISVNFHQGTGNKVYGKNGDDVLRVYGFNATVYMDGGIGNDRYIADFKHGEIDDEGNNPATIIIDNRDAGAADMDQLTVSGWKWESRNSCGYRLENGNLVMYRGEQNVIVQGWTTHPLTGIKIGTDTFTADDVNTILSTTNFIQIKESGSYSATDRKDNISIDAYGLNNIEISQMSSEDTLSVSYKYNVSDCYWENRDIILALTHYDMNYDEYETTVIRLRNYVNESGNGTLQLSDKKIIVSSEDVVQGSNGRDFIYMTRNGQTIYTNGGEDTVIVGSKPWWNSETEEYIDRPVFSGAKIYCSGSEEISIQGGSDNTIFAGTGSWVVITDSNSGTVTGTDGSFNASVSGMDNTVNGSSGDDSLTEMGAGNTLYGAAGADDLWSYGNGSCLEGGTGNDMYNVLFDIDEEVYDNNVVPKIITIDNRSAGSNDVDKLWIRNYCDWENEDLSSHEDYIFHTDNEGSLILSKENVSVVIRGWNDRPLAEISFGEKEIYTSIEYEEHFEIVPNETITAADVATILANTNYVSMTESGSYVGTTKPDIFAVASDNIEATISNATADDRIVAYGYDIADWRFDNGNADLTLSLSRSDTDSQATITLTGFTDSGSIKLQTNDNNTRNLISGTKETIFGTDENDLIIVDHSGQAVQAGGGNDFIKAGGNNCELDGGTGSDTFEVDWKLGTDVVIRCARVDNWDDEEYWDSDWYEYVTDDTLIIRNKSLYSDDPEQAADIDFRKSDGNLIIQDSASNKITIENWDTCGLTGVIFDDDSYGRGEIEGRVNVTNLNASLLSFPNSSSGVSDASVFNGTLQESNRPGILITGNT